MPKIHSKIAASDLIHRKWEYTDNQYVMSFPEMI
jgi:hypothetical protein